MPDSGDTTNSALELNGLDRGRDRSGHFDHDKWGDEVVLEESRLLDGPGLDPGKG